MDASNLDCVACFQVGADPREEHWFIGWAALTNTGSAAELVYVGNENCTFFVLHGGDASQKETDAQTGGSIRSTPAIAYMDDSNGRIERWVYITTRGYSGGLLAYKTGL